MIGFRDMTFCPFYEDCAKADQCHRPLTPAVRRAAEHWWKGKDFPIMIFVNEPECHEISITKEKNDENEA